ncbi:hypothetical protein CWO17_17880 [Vibrio sp. 10N.286.45.A3]|uniref:glycosyltransferase family 2 protein n=1 Tax=unclassified Vibrio TaxID=2614977 RepID=UPI000D393D8D|nr:MULTISPECIES: glycosyltransferase family A protein [unclassified Vibrio]PTP00081.1 hypothetical protein CWO17_17880 [Vibrio sp. 10N.286.45.A3]TKE75294.1 glycosyltransferase family 2 protein [Vibrio sp. F12]TKE95922.1 glycosyltransferase family 2 protein [Vibrio sp. F12]
MKIAIVIFNWNYGKFLEVLLDKMQFFYNDKSYTVHVCDDGSSDNSLEICEKYISEKKIRNITIHKKNKVNKGRSKPYLGQLENLENIYRNGSLDRCDYIWLMDADDYMDSQFFGIDFKRSLCGLDVAFTKVINKDENSESVMNIKRKANSDISIWPTISVTSSIIIAKHFLDSHCHLIFNYNKIYDDVWLDSRINMIASKIKNSKVSYIDFNVYRVIHSSNDSARMPLTRRLEKQIKSNNYFTLVCSNKKPFNIRTKILDILF